MKKLSLLLWTILVAIVLISFGSIQGKETKLTTEKLSDTEDYLLSISGNKVFKYKLKNLPKDKTYQILFTYEVYEGKEKVKEEIITGIWQDSLEDSQNEETIGFNYQEDKIRGIIGGVAAYATFEHEIKEDLRKGSHFYFGDDIDLPLGSEIYIYRAVSGDTNQSNVLGIPIDSVNMNMILVENETNIFIKLSFIEV